MKPPPINQHGTYERNLTKEEWRWIKQQAETKMKDAKNFWAWSSCHSQIKECEKHL